MSCARARLMMFGMISWDENCRSLYSDIQYLFNIAYASRIMIHAGWVSKVTRQFHNRMFSYRYYRDTIVFFPYHPDTIARSCCTKVQKVRAWGICSHHPFLLGSYHSYDRPWSYLYLFCELHLHMNILCQYRYQDTI